MFVPKYTITNFLLANIKRINSLIQNLNNKRFPHVILMELERSARAVSSFASTSIEGNPLPLTEVKRILKSEPIHIRDSEKEVLNYNQALQILDQKLKNGEPELSLEFILQIQKQVTAGLLPENECGHLRTRPVIVNNPSSRQVVFLPPDAADVPTLMQDLVKFTNTHQKLIDPLILAGIFHKQMVIIHPFMDGNGRTTRLATKFLLAEMGLNTFNLFSFENYYNQNVTKYFQIVGEFGNYYDLASKIDFTGWLEYFTAGIIDELLRVQKLLPQHHLEPHYEKILGFIQSYSTITHRQYAKLTHRAKPTRAKDLQKLVELGYLERRGNGRSTYYVLKPNLPPPAQNS